MAEKVRITENADDPKVGLWIELLFDQAGIAEGQLADPSAIVRRIQRVLDEVAGVASGEPTT